MPDTRAVEILLVEDNLRDVELTMRALRKHNLANAVTHVKDGEDALTLLFGDDIADTAPLQCRPRLVLLDLKLPKIDGPEVLARIRRHPIGRMIPVVVLTSSREEVDLVRCYNLGANSYIVKPVDFDKFSAAVATIGLYWLVINEPLPHHDTTGSGPAAK